MIGKKAEETQNAESAAPEAGSAAQREVVVGVDGSAPSRAALDWAAEAAVRRGIGLRIVCALSMPLVAMPFSAPVRVAPTPELADRAEVVLTRAVERVAEVAPALAVRTQVSSLEPAPALIVASRQAELVVVGSRGLGGTGSVFLGSVSVRVCAHGACPVVVVPPGDERRRPQERRRVVVGVDDSAHSGAALRFALGEAARLGAELRVVHAWHVPVPLDPLALGAADYAVDQQMLAERAEGRVRALVQEARSGFLDQVAVDVVVVKDHPAHALLTEAQEADLVVIGSRGRGGFRGLLLGSVSQAVLHHASAPVVVARTGAEHVVDEEAGKEHAERS